jgi:hypothetical protein
MALDFGFGVSRTLETTNRQFNHIIWQKDKPPLDSEMNLLSQIQWDEIQTLNKSMMPSGFITDPTISSQDIVTNPAWSNMFQLGRPRTITGNRETGEQTPVLWANVNGWIIPITGTDVNNSLSNNVRLYPPPESDTRVDYVFLEVWQTRVDANPSTVNKPAADKIWKYGNVKFGGTNLADDLEDPVAGIATTARVQVQYRLRVHNNVALDAYPDGLGDPNILGQGTSTSPIAGFYFSNVRETLGDASLWRAGNGNPNNTLGTVDGYVYAIPVCAIFRRNSDVYTPYKQATPNQNGAFNRTPGSKYLPNPLAASKALTTMTILSALDSDTGTEVDFTVQVSGVSGSGLDDSYHVLDNTFVIIDNEIIGGIQSVDTVNGTITFHGGSRGRYGTAAVGHASGAVISFYNSRPDGLYADQIAANDVLDLRRSVNAMDWDYSRLLQHSLGRLLKGSLKSAWKRSAQGDSQGPVVHEVDHLYAGSVTAFNHTEPLDGPDGIRTVFSDAATIQPDVTLLLDNNASTLAPIREGVNPLSIPVLDSGDWDITPGFFPQGFMNSAGLTFPEGVTNAFTNGSIIFLHLGGKADDGQDFQPGVLGTFRDKATRAVRAVMPPEFWKSGYPVVLPNNGNQHPVTIRPLGHAGFEPAPEAITTSAEFQGPMYPWRDLNFEFPYIVLGGLLNSSLTTTADTGSLANVVIDGVSYVELTLSSSFNFDTDGTFYHKDSYGNFTNDVSAVSVPLQQGRSTLYDLMTNGGIDNSGDSSGVYLLLYGDDQNRSNNGAFKVVGAGTVGYTTITASDANSLILKPLSQDFALVTDTSQIISIEFRSQYHDANDVQSGIADMAIAFTDLGGIQNHPWANLGSLALPTLSGDISYIPNKIVLNMTLLYHPGRGGTARVADEIQNLVSVGTDTTYLRQAPQSLDATFTTLTGINSDNNVTWEPNQVQLWNRLGSQGWVAPNAPSYGGNIIGFTEQDREHEFLVDRGSKTLMFRPYRRRVMTTPMITFTDFETVDDCLIGNYYYQSSIPGQSAFPKDGLSVYTGSSSSGKRMAVALPPEVTPRFGRQDIPFYVDISAGVGDFLPGINHLFRDHNPSSLTATTDVYNVIGGIPVEGSGGGAFNIKPMYFITQGISSNQWLYGSHTTIETPESNATPCYYGRKSTDIIDPTVKAKFEQVNSSDFGKGLKGIQLPPYQGVCRVYGIYTKDDFEDAGGKTFQADRATPYSDSAPNLLRQDSKANTLFIMQDGAMDHTGESDDHTYVIPSNVLDLTRSAYYGVNNRTQFEDFDYVVECSVFGFAKGFINKNNYVLVRRKNASGGTNLDGTELELVNSMVIPAPARYNENMVVEYDRTVYQGDPYMTRSGSLTDSDYEHRYGAVPVAGQYNLRIPIMQYDSNGDFVPQLVNPRALQVLASMDFYTTMGTGKLGGDLFAGTSLDIGYTETDSSAAYRKPASESSLPWRVETRAFTAGQKENTSRAMLDLRLQVPSTQWDAFATDESVFQLRIGLLDDTFVDLYGYKDSVTSLVDMQLAWNVSATQDWFEVTLDLDEVSTNIVNAINSHTGLQRTMKAFYNGNGVIVLKAIPNGAEGNSIYVGLRHLLNTGVTPSPVASLKVTDLMTIEIPFPNTTANPFAPVTGSFMIGGQDMAVNAGNGSSQVGLTGMTERLPLGALLQDSDFLCENPLGDNASAVKVYSTGMRPIQTLIPMTNGGEEFERFLGEPGVYIGQSDAQICTDSGYIPRHGVVQGTEKFRVFRGASAYMLSGNNPGGPIDWVSETFPSAFHPVLKGGILSGKALLVRNFYEELSGDNDPVVTSNGDEIQMIILTYGFVGTDNVSEAGFSTKGIISPSGYGEGYAACDRYLLDGRPMYRGFTQNCPNPVVQLATYPDTFREVGEE